MRYDGYRYAHCRWCHGRGCVYCEGEANKAYKRDFPDGPKPIATFTADEIDDAKQIIGMDALLKAFGKDGGGVEEIAKNFEDWQAKKKAG